MELAVNEEIINAPQFIEANTQAIDLVEIKEQHIIPVFTKDNKEIISHYDFVSGTAEVVQNFYGGSGINPPQIRMSHPIKGRVPSARNKAAKDLLDNEKTLYFERLAFIIEVPSIYETIDGKAMTLVVGGVRALNETNLYGYKGNPEKFKLFVGFRVKVCCNLSIWTDGYTDEVKVSSMEGLQAKLLHLIENFNAVQQVKLMQNLCNTFITERQFALILGRGKLYPFVPKRFRNDVVPITLGDSQLTTIAKAYYKDVHFAPSNQTISLWNMYNLFTGAVKSSYIDTFASRNVGCSSFITALQHSLEHSSSFWYLD